MNNRRRSVWGRMPFVLHPRGRSPLQPTPSDEEMRQLAQAATRLRDLNMLRLHLAAPRAAEVRTLTEGHLLSGLFGAGIMRDDVERRLADSNYGSGLERAARVATELIERPQVTPIVEFIGKGGKAIRQALEPELAADLAAMVFSRCADGHLPDQEAALSRPLIGRLSDGKMLTASGYFKAFKRLASRAGLPHLSPHGCRRKHADEWVRQNRPASDYELAVLASGMGQASLNTLPRYLTPTRSTTRS